MEKSFRSSSIIQSYVKHEISHKYEFLGPDLQQHLVMITSQFFEGSISYDDALSVFLSMTNDASLLEKVNQLIHIEDKPQAPEFQEQPKYGQQKLKRKSYPWSDGEDLRLLAAVIRFGARDWKLIADFVGGNRNSSQCNQRWCRALDPAINHNQWSPEEDLKLIHAVEALGKTSWSQVAKIIVGRTDLQCRYRHIQIEKSGKGSGFESATEDYSENSPKNPRRPSFDLEDSEETSEYSCLENMPYYLGPSMQPRTADSGRGFLHRLPPVLFERCTLKPHSFNPDEDLDLHEAFHFDSPCTLR